MERNTSLIIKNLNPGLVERGKIKIGMKGVEQKSKGGKNFQPPKKLDHFIVTGMQRGADGNFLPDEQIHGLPSIGKEPKRIPVRLLYNDIELNFQCRYAAYDGKSLRCSGDGEIGRWAKPDGTYQHVGCTCEYYGPRNEKKLKCKMNGTLSVIIDGANSVGGVWKFRTTSYNSTVGILSSLALLKRLSGGILAGIPLYMTINPKTVTNPQNGNLQLVYVVGLEYRGSAEQLQENSLQIAMTNAKHNFRIENIEEEAKRLLTADKVNADFGDPSDVSEEFYPEAFDDVPTLTAPETVPPATEPPVTEPPVAEKPKAKGKKKAKAKEERVQSEEAVKPEAPPVEETPTLAGPDEAPPTEQAPPPDSDPADIF